MPEQKDTEEQEQEPLVSGEGDSSGVGSSGGKYGGLWRLALLLAALAVLVCADWYFHLHEQLLDNILNSARFFQTRTPQAFASYFAAHVFVQLVCLPLTPVEIFTGFCFGWLPGICVDIVGRMTGGSLSFGCSRLLRS